MFENIGKDYIALNLDYGFRDASADSFTVFRRRSLWRVRLRDHFLL